MKLGVNIDHIAVLREARGVNSPNLIEALPYVVNGGAEQITIHLREDRRHIQDRDVKDLIMHSSLPINLECSIDEKIIDIVCALKPFRATLVPEKREELTTEGGLKVSLDNEKLKQAIKRLQKKEIEVSLFIEPDMATVEASSELKVEWVEFHTGKYANIYAMLFSNLAHSHHNIKELHISRKKLKEMLEIELEELKKAAFFAKDLGLQVAAGHGLNYHNVKAVAAIKEIEEFNIGQSIIAKSVFVGLEEAIREMKILLEHKNS